MNRTSSKSRTLKVQREVVRVLSSEQLASVGGGDGGGPIIAPSRLGASFCHPGGGQATCPFIPRLPSDVIIGNPSVRDPIFQSGIRNIC